MIAQPINFSSYFHRRMILLYHPDKNSSPEAAAKFLLVTKANECLTDESKRAVCE